MDTAFTGPDGLDCALTGIYDAIILDVMLPGMDGFSVLSALRAQKISTPVLMLTARGELLDRVQGLNLGADYYLPKPFERSELVACLNAITRRKDAPPVQALIVAMDVSPEEGYAASLLRITLIAGSIAWALLSLLTVLLIRRTLRPVQEAVAKQQQFVWDASHELKTPLAVISANAQVLEQELGGNEYFGYIRTEIGHMNDLVQNLLLLARMDAGRQSASFARFDLGATLLGLALPMESLAFEKGKQLDVQVQEGIFCRGNETLLVQLASILLSNALKYADEGGVITLSLEARGRQRLIRVHNTGSFIPPEERRKIFDRFYRADTSRAESGSGIGLAIAQSIAELHHGEILVESDLQTGTAFTAILPNQGE